MWPVDTESPTACFDAIVGPKVGITLACASPAWRCSRRPASTVGEAALRRMGVLAGSMLLAARPATALDRLCDPADENCRTILLNLIRNETVGIDVAFWFMEDARYTDELIRGGTRRACRSACSSIRARTPAYPLNADSPRRAAGRRHSDAEARRQHILHWKMMLFARAGRRRVQRRQLQCRRVRRRLPYANYVDEAIYFTDDAAIVDSFMTKFDDLWIDTIVVSRITRTSPARSHGATRFTRIARAELSPGGRATATRAVAPTTPSRPASTSSCTASPIARTPTR